MYGTYEFSDFHLDPSKYDVKPNAHVSSIVLHQYFNDFADHFDIKRRIRFNTRVLEVERLDPQGWRLKTECALPDDQGPQTVTSYVCEKLILGTGLESDPRPMAFKGHEDFGRPVLTHAHLKDDAVKLAEDPNVDTVTVVGASKSGYDAVFILASRGKKVEWVIRESGGGAVWMCSPWVPIGIGRRVVMVMLEHLATMRFCSWFSPCPWDKFDGFGWIRRFLHGTTAGRFLVHRFWEGQKMGTIEANGYRREPALKYLEPLQR